MPNGNELIEKLLAFAANELTSEQAAKLNNLIENNSDPRTSTSRTKHGYDPEKLERGFAFLKSRGISEDDINTVRGFYGISADPKVRAMDAAIRKSNSLARNTESYSRHFPEASRIGHS